MDNWAAHELALPTVPTPYFTTPYDLRPAQPVTAQLRKQLTALPASVTEVDMLVCDSAPRRAGDFSLWFSLRYAVALIDANGDVAETPEQAVYQRVEPNLLDTGFTFMYYPSPSNFTNAAITGGPVIGGTSVVIEGSGARPLPRPPGRGGTGVGRRTSGAGQARASGSAVTSDSFHGRLESELGKTLKSRSPSARETASVCMTRPLETHPPAAVMRAVSSARSGLWSTLGRHATRRFVSSCFSEPICWSGV